MANAKVSKPGIMVNPDAPATTLSFDAAWNEAHQVAPEVAPEVAPVTELRQFGQYSFNVQG